MPLRPAAVHSSRVRLWSCLHPFYVPLPWFPSKSLVCCLNGGGIGHAVGLNSLDAHLGKVLPVSLQFLVLLFPLQVEDQDLVAAPLAEYLGGHLGSGWLGQASGLA